MVSTPNIPRGLPSQLLERRPDIRQAEDQLISLNAQIGALAAVVNIYSAMGGGWVVEAEKRTR